MTSLGNFVLEVHTALFDSHDTSVLDKHFADSFVEHSPSSLTMQKALRSSSRIWARD